MNETPADNAFDPVAEQLPPDLTGELPQGPEMHGDFDAAEALRASYAGWLERRGIDPATTPHLTMGRREFDFALTKVQRDNRDATFNGYMESLISETARKNRVAEQARRDDEYRARPLQARQLPRP